MKKIIFKILNSISVLIFVCLVAVVFWQVVCRFVLKISAPWTEELARVMVVWLTFLCIAEVEAHHDGIRTLFLIQKLPRLVYKTLLILSDIAAICLHICLFLGAIKQIHTNSIYYLSSMPFLSRTVFYYPILVGSPLSIWMLIEEIIDFIKTPMPLYEALPGGDEK